MAIMNLNMLAAVSSIWKPIISLLDWMNSGIGNFGWTVVVFTLLLRLLLTPFDIWQKISMRKQKAKMDVLRPQMEKLQKQYANRPDILRQKQYELQKSAHINMFASCLPMIFTLVIFALIFQGFREYIISANEKIVSDLYNNVYVQFFIDHAQTISEATGKTILNEAGQLAVVPSYSLLQDAGLIEELNAALVAGYQPQSWLWVKNVFMSDTFANVIPNYNNFISTGFGGIAATIPDVPGTSYNELMNPIIAAYNKTKFFDMGRWNGYFVLPILSILTSFFSTMLQQKLQPMQPMTTGDEAQQKQQKMMNKIMVYMMPLVLGFFAIVYSAAFAIYYFTSNLFMTIVTLIFNLITRKQDAKKAQQPIITTTFATQPQTPKKVNNKKKR
ncbi:MAG: membrane protein insertase YidC [Clostridia bacterium]|nr:membrane protein insertase YidC [Clostridia bacterium]